MIEAAGRAVQYCAGFSFDEFVEDTKTQDAVTRNIEIMGEATKNLSGEIRERHKNIPWKSIAGMRDRLIHGYFGVNLDIVWAVVREDLPPLIESAGEVVDDLE